MLKHLKQKDTLHRWPSGPPKHDQEPVRIPPGPQEFQKLLIEETLVV